MYVTPETCLAVLQFVIPDFMRSQGVEPDPEKVLNLLAACLGTGIGAFVNSRPHMAEEHERLTEVLRQYIPMGIQHNDEVPALHS